MMVSESLLRKANLPVLINLTYLAQFDKENERVDTNCPIYKNLCYRGFE